MSLRGKDFRCEIEAEVHDRLRKMAEFQGIEVSALGAQLLEKMIVAEWHSFSILLERMERSGIVRSVNGAMRNRADDVEKQPEKQPAALTDEVKKELFEAIKKELIRDASKGGALSRALRP